MVSKECFDLVKKMLKANPELRISAKNCISHPWIKKCMDSPVTDTDVMLSLNSLKNFQTQMVFQRAVLTYIASQQLAEDEEQKIRKMFAIFDANGDGQISLEELVIGYNTLFKGDLKRAQREANMVMRNIDINKNGSIDYNEFKVATMSINHALSEEKLKEAFAFYDADGNGEISLEELKNIFGTVCDEVTLSKLIAEVDANGDGVISFEEFK